MPHFDILQCLPRLPHFDAGFTVSSCGSNSPVGRMFFAASDQNSHQLNLLFEAFNVHELILPRIVVKGKFSWFVHKLNKCRTPPKPKSIDQKPHQSIQKPLWRANEAFDGVIVPSRVTKRLCWANFEFGLEVWWSYANASIINLTYNAWRSILYLPFYG